MSAAAPGIQVTAIPALIASWTTRQPGSEISGVPPFWEDQLYREKYEIVRFRIGDVEIHGVNPCQRCNVPPRDPDTGELIPRFQEIFSKQRRFDR